MRLLIIISLCILGRLSIIAQNEILLDFFDVKKSLLTMAKADKIYLQTDRYHYAIGELVYFKVFLTDENRMPKKDGVVYVELINAETEIIAKRVIKIEEGIGNGDFELPIKIMNGQHFIRAYTSFMRNQDAAFFFRKTIIVGNGVDVSRTGFQNKAPFSLQFFPEGGDLVEGMKSVVAIKATNNKGKLAGLIINANKEQITTFKTDSLGFGRFELLPTANQDYFAIITEKGKTRQWKLPKALTEGVVIHTNKEEETNLLKIQLDFSKNNKLLKNGHLIGHINGNILLFESIGNTFSIGLDTLPAGIIHLTFLDELGQPRAERLVFNDTGINDYFLDFVSKKEIYSKNNPIEIEFDLFNEQGRGISSNLLVSVCRQQYSNNSSSGMNIRDYFFFHADLPNFPFYPLTTDVEKNNSPLIDLILMTYGWRRFHWQDILKAPQRKNLFPEENSLTIWGKITKKDKSDEPVKANVMLTTLNDNFLNKTVETDEEGFFLIDSLDIYGKTDVIIQAAKAKKNKKGKLSVEGNRNVSIHIEPKIASTFSIEDTLALSASHYKINKTIIPITLKSTINSDDFSDLGLSIDIDEVTVTAKKIDKIISYYEEGMLYTQPDNRIVTATMPSLHQYNNIYDILRGQVSGMELVRPEKEGTQKAVIFRGLSTGLSKDVKIENGARFMVNGAFVSQNYVESIPPQNIAFLDVIKSLNKLTPFGELGVNGLIMVYLRPPEKNIQKSAITVNGIHNYPMEGYYEARTFPVLNKQKKIQATNTLYWNAEIMVDESGEYLLNFTAPANSGVFDIIVEGMSEKGMPIFGKHQIIIE